ncbi:hypothetical protein KKH23_05640 [Patescibacteria group bacterium]|nr:hypothetical protein [Patescibacteria group bacterium]
MKTIWKYTIPLEGRFSIGMPVDAEILCLQIQHGEPRIWALVDPDAEIEEREFVLYGTGHPIERTGSYVGTYQTGSFVFHVFEV